MENINHSQALNFGEFIQNWKENCQWIDGIINPYVAKDIAGIWMNPVVYGEVIVRFYILDKTFFANRQELTFERN